MRDIELIVKLYKLIELLGKREVDALLNRVLAETEAKLEEAYAEKALEEDRALEVEDLKRTDWEDINGTDDDGI